MKTKTSDKLDTKSVERPTYKALEQEVMEQARLNGMGSEREARLMASVTELQRENAALRQDGICRRRGIPTKEESKRIKDRDEHIERLWKENAALRHALQTALAIESLDDANLEELIARCRCVMREQAAIDAARKEVK